MHIVRISWVEVVVRALSSEIGDPHTAMSVLDRVGATLCDLVGRQLPGSMVMREDAVPLFVEPELSGLADVMFQMIRKHQAGSTALSIRLLDVSTAAIAFGGDPGHRQVLLHHEALAWTYAQRTIGNQTDLAEVERRYLTLLRTASQGALAAVGARGAQ